MELIEYLQTLNSKKNPFIVCVNVNCDAFRQMSQGVLDENLMEEVTFFRAFAENILNNETISKILENTKVIKHQKDRRSTPGEDIYFVSVDYPHDYKKAKNKLMELLS